ncbi:MAG: 1-acyl-sn-glycerol-3-phosphate acyltransferase [Cyclobacteriaceae bacterium]|nr:1-acyl-sn-glycerol-3-phosphate acyltransferase [Cyclobacteriaceae bacterium]
MGWLWRIILKIIHWEIEGDIPAGLNKFIIVVAPHTSNWDFLLGIIARGARGFHSNFLGKSSLFTPPFGFIFKAIGGIPVDRSRNNKLVDQVVREVERRPKFGLAVAPEGTRKKVVQWKTGFYFIAVKAGIPIIPVQFDWEKRAVRFLDPFYPTGDLSRDLPTIQSKFTNIRGKADLHKHI